MRVELLPFGVLKETLKSPFVLDLPEAATVGDLLSIVSSQAGFDSNAKALLRRIAVSVNAEYAQRDQRLRDGDRVGLLPPVSGGSDLPSTAATPAILAYLTRDPIQAVDLVEIAKSGEDGAVVVFDGIVRNNTRGRRTLYLDYEAYEEMASAKMQQLAAEAILQFGIRAVTLVHRLGRLQIGETSVLIVVSSAHRGPAFEASRWLIDTLKTTIPIWKKETFVDGAVWTDGEPFPAGLALNPHGDLDEKPFESPKVAQ